MPNPFKKEEGYKNSSVVLNWLNKYDTYIHLKHNYIKNKSEIIRMGRLRAILIVAEVFAFFAFCSSHNSRKGSRTVMKF